MSFVPVDIQVVKDWFVKNQRKFPWREKKNPYAVWIAEVMLQQTRANVVISYFNRWMKNFPDITTLANSPLEIVIKNWEGLGYYSRARNIHKAAKIFMEKFQGKIPCSRKILATIPGLGPYTVEAILAFGFHKRASPVDANVCRVLSRLFCIEKDISKESTKKDIGSLEDNLLCSQKPWITAEAYIELGALICKKKPLCKICPLISVCLAYKQGRVNSIPFSSKSISYVYKKRLVLLIEAEHHFLLRKEKENKIMADLYEFPHVDIQDNITIDKAREILFSQFFVSGNFYQKYPHIQQSFTNNIVTLFPYHFLLLHKTNIPGWQWVAKDKIDHLPFSSGHRKIITKFLL